MKQFIILLIASCLGLSSGQCTPTQEQIDALKADVDNITSGITSTDEQAVVIAVCTDPLRQYTNGIETKVKACVGLLVAQGTGLANLRLGDKAFTSLFSNYFSVKQFCDCAMVTAPVFMAGLQVISTRIEAGQAFCSDETRVHLANVYDGAKNCSELTMNLEALSLVPIKYLLKFTSAENFCAFASGTCNRWTDLDTKANNCVTSSDDSGDGCKNRACIASNLGSCANSLLGFYAKIMPSNMKVASEDITCGACSIYASIATVLVLMLAALFY